MWGMIVSVTSGAALLLLSSVVFSQNVTIAPSLIAEGKVLCNPDVYGLNPQEPSCLNAWSKIPRTASEIVYGHRGLPGVEVVIPVRYQSDDGLCVVELRPRQQRRIVQGDVATGIEISDAMPAGYRNDQFIGPRDTPTRSDYSRLPKRYIGQDAEGDDCEVTVSRHPMDGGSIEKWHTIFAAGIDVYTMCVEQGMSGTVFDLGWSSPQVNPENILPLPSFFCLLHLFQSNQVPSCYAHSFF
ncbi:MAG: hypothetical protein Q9197_001307 [Variospora fuerteventurae]